MAKKRPPTWSGFGRTYTAPEGTKRPPVQSSGPPSAAFGRPLRERFPSSERIAEALPRVRRKRGLTLRAQQAIEEFAIKSDATSERIHANRDKTIDAELRWENDESWEDILDDIRSQIRSPGPGWFMSVGAIYVPEDGEDEDSLEKSGEAYRDGTLIVTGRFAIADAEQAFDLATQIFDHIGTEPGELIVRLHSAKDTKLKKRRGKKRHTKIEDKE